VPATIRSAGSCAYVTQATEPIPLRKQLKDEAREKKSASSNGTLKPSNQHKKLDGWELTVGIEIHAQLNTARKLFSREQTRQFMSLKLIWVRCGHFNQR
jgi:GatB/GatE catalytic domain